MNLHDLFDMEPVGAPVSAPPPRPQPDGFRELARSAGRRGLRLVHAPHPIERLGGAPLALERGGSTDVVATFSDVCELRCWLDEHG